MRLAALVFLCALPFGSGCLRDGNAHAQSAAASAPELAQFEEVVARIAREPAHTAVAFAAGPDQLSWGVAVAARTAAEARALALSRCTVRARLARITASCALYAVDGRALYLERN
jgi:hypothetical protein